MGRLQLRNLISFLVVIVAISSFTCTLGATAGGATGRFDEKEASHDKVVGDDNDETYRFTMDVRRTKLLSFCSGHTQSAVRYRSFEEEGANHEKLLGQLQLCTCGSSTCTKKGKNDPRIRSETRRFRFTRKEVNGPNKSYVIGDDIGKLNSIFDAAETDISAKWGDVFTRYRNVTRGVIKIIKANKGNSQALADALKDRYELGLEIIFSNKETRISLRCSSATKNLKKPNPQPIPHDGFSDGSLRKPKTKKKKNVDDCTTVDTDIEDGYVLLLGDIAKTSVDGKYTVIGQVLKHHKENSVKLGKTFWLQFDINEAGLSDAEIAQFNKFCEQTSCCSWKVAPTTVTRRLLAAEKRL